MGLTCAGELTGISSVRCSTPRSGDNHRKYAEERCRRSIAATLFETRVNEPVDDDQQGARHARCGVKTTCGAVRGGQLRAAKVGGRRELRFLAEWLDEYLIATVRPSLNNGPPSRTAEREHQSEMRYSRNQVREVTGGRRSAGVRFLTCGTSRSSGEPRNHLPVHAAELESAANAWGEATDRHHLESGCRPGEILSLQWREVSLSRMELRIPMEKSKTGQVRETPI